MACPYALELMPSGTLASSPSSPARGAVAVGGFRELYDAHFDFVWRSLARLAVPPSDLPDAAQEVFLVVHRKLGTFEGRSRLSTWIFGIAFRVAQARRGTASRRREISVEAEELEARADQELAGAPPDSLGAALEQLLSELPIEQRVVFMLFELEGFSGDEIAELVAVPVGTVRSRLRLAREAFRKAAQRLQAREHFDLSRPHAPTAAPPGASKP